MKFKTLASILSLLIGGIAFGQVDKLSLKPLSIGDSMPDELWALKFQQVNHPAGITDLTLGDYRDKLVIIDFWATWCTPCVRGLHILDKLQGQFTDEILVLPVTYEDAEKAAALFEKQGLSLSSAVSDTSLRSYFPHRSIPHQVWVKNNQLRGIVHSEDATSANVSEMLNNDDFTLHTKKDILDYNTTESITTYATRVGAPVLLSSLLTGYIEGAPALVSWINKGTSPSVSYNNVSVMRMYKRTLQVANNRIIVHAEDNDKYVYVKGNRAQSYCYQLKFPARTPDSLVRKRILEDLNFSFELEVDTQEMDVDCYLITDMEKEDSRTLSVESLASKKGTRMSSVTGLLNDFMLWKPNLPIYIDESDREELVKVNLETLKSSRENPDAVKMELEAIGLTLKKEKRVMKMYILKETGK